MSKNNFGIPSRPQELLDFDGIREAINRGGSGAEVLATVIVSTYWKTKTINLYSLQSLDADNLQHAINIMTYRKRYGWDDEKFWQLAKDALLVIAYKEEEYCCHCQRTGIMVDLDTGEEC